MTNSSIDEGLVRTLAQLLDETGLTEIEYDNGQIKLRVARQGSPVAGVHFAPHYAPAAAAPGAAATAVEDKDHPGAIASPMVGVCYLRPEPDKPPFVNVGDMVSEGQTLLLIEAMKTFNPIKAPRGGKVTRVLVSDGHAVEFAEPLLILE